MRYKPHVKGSNFTFQFRNKDGDFQVDNPSATRGLYFPLANEEGLLGFTTPDLQGALTLDQHSFLNPPLVSEDLHLSRGSFNFWLSFGPGQNPWSVSGRSVWQRSAGDEQSSLQAGLLWHEVSRVSKKRGLSASVFSFIPSNEAAFEVMVVEVKNISKKKISFTLTSAIPLYGRSADNVRDHRHVTSLLNRVFLEKHGLTLKPTMSFNERGHLINNISYYVLGFDAKGAPAAGVFPTVDSFIGEAGDLEKPAALAQRLKPVTKLSAFHQGREALGGLQFKPVTLAAGQATRFAFLVGIDRTGATDHTELVKQNGSLEKIYSLWTDTQAHWRGLAERIQFETGDDTFNRWMMWVKTQPTLRKLFGNSFLPDFDYGRGGRGWRDLWQDCLALLLSEPTRVRQDMLNNFGGVRPDGSNATIIVRKKSGVDFIADRNNISRVWMDHGLWPFFTTQLYLHQTGDWKFLQEEAPYFDAGPSRGTVLEHLLLQTVAPFFDVGEHNNIRLLDADWNDGLDMGHDRGESVAFTAFFAGNLENLADILRLAKEKNGLRETALAEEMLPLFDTLNERVNYNNVGEKVERRNRFRASIGKGFSGRRSSLSIDQLCADLKAKAVWIKEHLNKQEWISHEGAGWFNGYYDNKGRRVDGPQAQGLARMTLTGQVFPIMSGVADDDQVRAMVKSVRKHLFDPSLGSVRLNTDFGGLQPDLGRAFSFVYGDKENGAVFSHMVVMYANALYRRGFAAEGFEVLSSLYKMATKSARSRIYPGLPEYFNAEGRGLYCYLTGSASWYVYTLLTQAFGLRGEAGDLLIAPKLMPAQFDRRGQASAELFFAGVRVKVMFRNAKKLSYDAWRVGAVTANGKEAPVLRRGDKEVLLERAFVTKSKSLEIEVELL